VKTKLGRDRELGIRKEELGIRNAEGGNSRI
jgi:hypothetical protein